MIPQPPWAILGNIQKINPTGPCLPDWLRSQWLQMSATQATLDTPNFHVMFPIEIANTGGITPFCSRPDQAFVGLSASAGKSGLPL